MVITFSFVIFLGDQSAVNQTTVSQLIAFGDIATFLPEI